MCKKNLRKIKEVNNQGLYELLGVPADAEESALRKAYKRLALQCHPHKGGDLHTFQLIQEAYTVLTGPLRGLYDACGEEGLELKKQAKTKVRRSMCRDHISFVFLRCIVGELSRIQP